MCGGISVSLDIHKAFDSLHHEFLLESMCDAGFEQCEIDLIMHLHQNAALCFGSQASAKVFMGSGVRQGCSFPQLLWALITGLLHRKYQEALSFHQLCEGTTTLFADDVFGSWLFTTPAAFKRAIRAIGVRIAAIQKAGLQLSMEKTVIVYTAQGTSAASIIGRYRTFIDELPHFIIPIGQARTPLKVVTEHKYLGAMLSYRNFELSNLRHRLSVMWGAFWRLFQILRCQTLPLHTKTRLWRVCVFSVLRYSLCCNGEQLIQQAAHRQLRLIAKSPAHIWHVTSADILARLRLEDPWVTLCKEAQSRSPRPGLGFCKGPKYFSLVSYFCLTPPALLNFNIQALKKPSCQSYF